MTETPATTKPTEDAPLPDGGGNAPATPGSAADPYMVLARTTSRRWPSSHDAATWPVLAAAALAFLVGALTLPLTTVGVAGLVTGLAVLAVPGAVVATNRAAARRLCQPLPLLAGAGAAGLFAVGTFRAAGWLYVLCVVTAVWLISYAVSAGRRWPAVLLGGAVGWAGIFRGGPWLAGGATEAWRSMRAMAADSHVADPNDGGDDASSSPVGSNERTPRGIGPAAVVVITVVILLVFGSLLASADDEFGSLLADVFSLPSPDLGGRLVLGITVAAFALGAAYATRVPPRLDRLATSDPRPIRSYEWATPMAALVLLFAVFTTVQFAALFGGQNHLNLTDGLTYAEYARSGFGELVLVTVLTLGVLAAAARWAPRETPSQRTLLRTLAGAVCVFALVIVASALYRMDLYQDAYGMTVLRLLVTTFELWLGVIFVLILAAGVRLRATWLPRAVVGTAVAALFGLVAINPDAYIAKVNVARFAETGKIDPYYLRDLSADAVPALMKLPEPERSCALSRLVDELAADEPWPAFNLARSRARETLADTPVTVDYELCMTRY